YLAVSNLETLLIYETSTGNLLSTVKSSDHKVISSGPNCVEGATSPLQFGDQFTDSDIISFDFSLNSTLVIIGFEDGYLEIWNFIKNELLYIFAPDETPTGYQTIYQIVSSPYKRNVAILSDVPDCQSGEKIQLKIINIEEGKEKNIYVNSSKFSSTTLISPEFKLFQFSSHISNENSGIDVYDINYSSNQIELNFLKTIFDNLPNKISFSPNNMFLANIQSIRSINIIDLQSNSRIFTIETSEKTLDISNAIFSPDGSLLITIHESKDITLWNVGSKHLINSFFVSRNSLNNLFFTSKENELILDYEGCKIYHLNIDSGFRNESQKENCFTDGFSYSSDLNSFIVINQTHLQDINISIYETTSFKLKTSITFSLESYIESVALSNNNTLLAIGLSNESIQLWDTQSKSLVKTLQINQGANDLRFSPNEEYLAFRDWAFRNCCSNLILQKISDWSIILNISERYDPSSSLVFSPDSKYLLTSNADLDVYNVETGEKEHNFENLSVSSLSFASNGLLALISSEQRNDTNIDKLELWNFTDKSLIQMVKEGSNLGQVAISKSGDRLAFGLNTIEIYRIDINSHIPVFLDDDLDGLPNSWEALYGLNFDNYWDRFDDPDNDGLMNSIEFQFGLNPLNKDSDNNGISDREQLGFPLYRIRPPGSADGLLLIVMLFGLLSLVISFIYVSKIRQKDSTGNFFLKLTEQKNLRSFRALYQKIVIGLENSKRDWVSNYPEEELDLLIERESQDYTNIIDVFPSDIQHDIKSELRGRSILILIELAYKFPEQAHTSGVAESLKIPRTTVSFEIKKLLFLQYIQQNQDLNSLHDTRFKYYSLTPKG
ncbi:MAG: WD40 repeat domain-containing protein, partial [Candidatus Kariarchaeaceae archaeon]